MRIPKFNPNTVAAIALILISALSASAIANGPAQFAPASSGLYVEVNNIAELRKQWENDPLAAFIRKNLPLPAPDKGWNDAKKMLGMTDAQIIDTYFGQSAALVFRAPGDSEPGMVISKVAAKDAEHFRKRFMLTHLNKVGAFDNYVTPDMNTNVLIGNGWMMAFSKRYAVPIHAVLLGKKPALADDDTFKTWTTKLPADRTGTLYIHDGSKQEVHVAGMVKQKRNVTLHYVGKSQEYKALFAMIQRGRKTEFGPLPADTLAAASINLRNDQDIDPKAGKFLDSLANPKSFTGDILPYIDSPLVAFLGEVKGDQFKENPGLDIPAPGFAIKIKKHAVADDVTRMIDGVLLLANFTMAKWEVEPIVVKETKYKDVPFKTANIGIALSQRVQRPELKSLVLSYGRVGDWYIICSQDHFYRKCIEAELTPATSLSQSESFKALGLKDYDEPIAAAFMKPEHLSRHVQSWLDHWQRVRPEVFKTLDEPKTAEAQFIRGIQIAKGLLSQFDSISVQIHRRGDDMVARLDIMRD